MSILRKAVVILVVASGAERSKEDANREPAEQSDVRKRMGLYGLSARWMSGAVRCGYSDVYPMRDGQKRRALILSLSNVTARSCSYLLSPASHTCCPCCYCCCCLLLLLLLWSHAMTAHARPATRTPVDGDDVAHVLEPCFIWL